MSRSPNLGGRSLSDSTFVIVVIMPSPSVARPVASDRECLTTQVPAPVQGSQTACSSWDIWTKPHFFFRHQPTHPLNHTCVTNKAPGSVPPSPPVRPTPIPSHIWPPAGVQCHPPSHRASLNTNDSSPDASIYSASAYNTEQAQPSLRPVGDLHRNPVRLSDTQRPLSPTAWRSICDQDSPAT